MVSLHRIVEQVPWEDRVPTTQVDEAVPVLVRPRFCDGYEGETSGEAVAWSPRAVQVRFNHPDPQAPPTNYKVWIPADRVQPLRDFVGQVPSSAK